MEAQFQPVNDPSVPAVIETVDEAMRAYSFAPTSETTLTNPTDVQDAIRSLKVDKAPGPDGIPNMVSSNQADSLLPALFDAILPGGLEAPTRVIDPEKLERPDNTLVLSTH